MKLKITTNNEQHFYGHGKLMITGEYFVLDGASALAVPTKLGQHLRVTELSSSERLLYLVALNSQNKVWLQLTFETENFTCLLHHPKPKRCPLYFEQFVCSTPLF